MKRQEWQFIVIIDELWLYLTPNYEQARLRPDKEPPEGPKRTIHDKRIMVTMAWNPLEFHMLDALPTGGTFDAEHDRDNIVTALVPLPPAPGAENLLFMQIIQVPIRLNSASPFMLTT
jgi:hypothetical protein